MDTTVLSISDNEGVYGEIHIRHEEGNVYNICHTYVSERYRGKGVADLLLKMALEFIEYKGGTVKADCSYAARKLSRMGK